MEAEMNQFTFAKQMLDFNRTTFANTFGAMRLFQEQSEKMITTFVEQVDWIPSEGKKAIADMAVTFRKSVKSAPCIPSVGIIPLSLVR